MLFLSLSNSLPVRWVREAGFTLIADSYNVIFLFTILVIIVKGGEALLANALPSYCLTMQCTCVPRMCMCTSCSSGASIATWLSAEKTNTVLVLTEVAVPKRLLDAIASLSPVNIEPVVSEAKSVYEMATAPVNTMLTSYVLVLVGLDYLADFLQSYWWQLIFLGAVFWSVPGRLGRITSGWMISFPVVFYLGLPGLRLFMGWFTGYGDVLTAFNATVFGNLIPTMMSSFDPIQFGINFASKLLQAGNDFAGYMVLRLIALGLYTTLLTSMAGGVAAMLSRVQLGETHIEGA